MAGEWAQTVSNKREGRATELHAPYVMRANSPTVNFHTLGPDLLAASFLVLDCCLFS